MQARSLNIIELFGPDAAPLTAFPTDRDGAAPLTTPDIAGITADSRLVKPGFLFAALKGAAADGRRFAGEAAARGAVAILTDDPAALALDDAARRRLAIIADPNPQRRLALIAARFHPQRPKTLVGVTGTNGKTSVAHFTREIWQALGRKSASLGTLGWVADGERHPGALTTPDPVALHRTLAALAERGVDCAAVEASSHGLAQYRLDGIAFAAAAFTNLTRDHLDYHGDMASYRAAKQRLFAALLAPGATAVLNADSPEFAGFAALAGAHGHPVLSYGENGSADLRLVDRRPRPDGQHVTLSLYGMPQTVELKLIGDFQAMNVLAALGLTLATGADPARAVAALPSLTTVPGRMQLVGEHNGAAVFVDYAHTPDALQTVLAAARPHVGRELVVVFGAGGDRDRGKRPLMGRVTAAGANRVYVTDDNPRGEDAAAIRRAILAAAPGAVEIADRRAAIYAAIDTLQPGDVLVIAGKGHETGQIIGKETLPFDDVAVARQAIARPAGRATGA
ncbi:MAG TPA: UDP-N-acetylmuramoyl-L-alanyl-D-glutamate--2,6-diaminopimelate ligase [Stellaceae bacterium]|nr:UDP-N-acetylmuramoyl-L-alanyl-D-glutamate--2,6-diaminopimelate ligase [Stellaceae bacterium]